MSNRSISDIRYRSIIKIYMASILIIGADPETREILRLRFEVDGIKVMTALGKEDAIPAIKSGRPDCALIDLIDLSEEETEEALAIIRAVGQAKIQSVLLMPRNFRESPPGTACETSKGADLVVNKPYDLNALAQNVNRLINNPRRSCSSHRDFHRRS